MQNWEVQYIKEFRYDAARQRYLNIEHDPAAYRDGIVNPSNPGELVLNPLSRMWTDYDGDEPYGDFQITQSGNPSTIANLRSFELGTGLTDPWTGCGGSGGANSKYYHADLIGTTRLLSDASGSAAAGLATVFTAFGERVSGASPTDATRYGYAGEWGYQTHADFPFLHVGHRYYDPSTGRFMQRDPIGISGGANVYSYVSNNPVETVDPEGFTRLDIKVIYPKAPPPVNPAKPLIRVATKAGIKRAALICGVGGFIVVEVADRIIAPAIDAHSDYKEEKAGKELGKPFDPNDPWGWTEKTPGAGSWRKKRRQS